MCGVAGRGRRRARRGNCGDDGLGAARGKTFLRRLILAGLRFCFFTAMKRTTPYGQNFRPQEN